MRPMNAGGLGQPATPAPRAVTSARRVAVPGARWLPWPSGRALRRQAGSPTPTPLGGRPRPGDTVGRGCQGRITTALRSATSSVACTTERSLPPPRWPPRRHQRRPGRTPRCRRPVDATPVAPVVTKTTETIRRNRFRHGREDPPRADEDRRRPGSVTSSKHRQGNGAEAESSTARDSLRAHFEEDLRRVVRGPALLDVRTAVHVLRRPRPAAGIDRGRTLRSRPPPVAGPPTVRDPALPLAGRVRRPSRRSASTESVVARAAFGPS